MSTATRNLPATELSLFELTGRLAGLANRSTTDPQEVEAARAELPRAKAEHQIRQALATPGLTPEQRRRLLLRLCDLLSEALAA